MKRKIDSKPSADPRAMQRPAPVQDYCPEMTDEEYRAIRTATDNIEFAKTKVIETFKV